MVILITIMIFAIITLGISLYSIKEHCAYIKARECYEELIIELIKELEEYRDSDND